MWLSPIRHLHDLAWLFSTDVLPPDKVIGRAFFDVSPKAPPRWRDVHLRVLAGAEMAQDEDFVARQDGRAVWVRWSMNLRYLGFVEGEGIRGANHPPAYEVRAHGVPAF
jgi:hypothetical protein